MGLAMECNRKMRIRIGDGVYIYTDKSVQLLIEAPPGVNIRREQLLSKEGTYNDRRDAQYSEKKTKRTEEPDAQSRRAR